MLLPGPRAPTAALLSLAADQLPAAKTRGWASFLLFWGCFLLALSLAKQIKPISPQPRRAEVSARREQLLPGALPLPKALLPAPRSIRYSLIESHFF